MSKPDDALDLELNRIVNGDYLPPEYGVRWEEFNRKHEVITKERFFKSDAKRAAFVEKLEQRDNFYRTVAWCEPRKV